MDEMQEVVALCALCDRWYTLEEWLDLELQDRYKGYEYRTCSCGGLLEIEDAD